MKIPNQDGVTTATAEHYIRSADNGFTIRHVHAEGGPIAWDAEEKACLSKLQNNGGLVIGVVTFCKWDIDEYTVSIDKGILITCDLVQTGHMIRLALMLNKS